LTALANNAIGGPNLGISLTKVAILKNLDLEGVIYILIGTGLLIVWILVRRHKR
jgi:hypothetical protein